MGVSLSHGVDTCCEKVSPYQGSHFLTGITFSRNTCTRISELQLRYDFISFHNNQKLCEQNNVTLLFRALILDTCSVKVIAPKIGCPNA